MKRFILLFLSLIFLSSCGKTEEKPKNIIKNFISEDFYVTVKNKNLDFEISEEKIIFSSPEMLKGAELCFDENGNIQTNFGINISLPQSSVSSIKALVELLHKIKTEDTIVFEEKNGTFYFEEASFNIDSDEIEVTIGEQDFILKRRTKNGTYQSDGGS